jgi:hypothetical protein
VKSEWLKSEADKEVAGWEKPCSETETSRVAMSKMETVKPTWDAGALTTGFTNKVDNCLYSHPTFQAEIL